MKKLTNMGNTCLRLYFLHLSCSLQMLSVMKVKHMVSASYFVLCGFVKKKIGHDFCPLWKTSLGGRAGRSFLKPFLKVSSQNFPHYFTWYRWLRKYPIFFQPIRVQNYDVSFAMVLHFFNRCYTWTALRSANQNRAFFFMYIIRVVMRIICIEFLQFKFFIIIFIIDP